MKDEMLRRKTADMFGFLPFSFTRFSFDGRKITKSGRSAILFPERVKLVLFCFFRLLFLGSALRVSEWLCLLHTSAT